MKRMFALFLALCICVGFCACGEEESATEDKKLPDGLMPYTLQFGMSYDEAFALYGKMEGSIFTLDLPELTPASANDGYVTSDVFMHFSDFYGLDEDTIAYYANLMFSFNESKQLYEFYAGATAKSEGDAEKIYNCVVDHYAKQLNMKAVHEEYDSMMRTEFTTDSVVVQVRIEKNSDGEYDLLVVIHCFLYELNS